MLTTPDALTQKVFDLLNTNPPAGVTVLNHDALPVEEEVPGTLSYEKKRELEEIAKQVHQALSLRHYSRSDFLIHPKRGAFVLSTSTHPAMTETSLFPKGLSSVGSTLSHFSDHILGLALNGK